MLLLLAAMCGIFAPQGAVLAEDAAVRQALICLAEDLPDNRPYSAEGTAYSRDAATPLLSGAGGFIYKRTAEVNTWLFSVPASPDTPTLSLRLDGISALTGISLNQQPLSSTRPVAIPLNETAELRYTSARTRGVIRLIFTTLPVIRVEVSGTLYVDRDTACRITVSDPDYLAHGQDEPVAVYEAVISRRGRSSARYAAKHPYNFTLMRDGEKWDHPLLGLRADSDWLLDSAYNDRSRMRNRVLMDVWHATYRLPWDQTLSGATRGAFVELFVGDAYRGLYALGEKQDRLQLGLAKAGGRWNSLLLRTGAAGKDQSSPAGFVSLGTARPGSSDPLRWYNVDIRYPKDTASRSGALWSDFYEYVRLVVEGTPEEFAARIADYADLDNLARYWLFANATDLTDNMRKNMTFARLDDRDTRFNRFILVPWDMDSSLGRHYTSKKSRVDELITNRLFTRLIRENPGGFLDILRADWDALRDTALSADTIMARFEDYYAAIHQSGADLREIAKYPTFTSYVKAAYSYELNFDSELAYLRSFLEKRIAWLDSQVDSLCGPR